MKSLFKTFRRLRRKLALTPEQADKIRFPCC
ncbi:hypothetical protein SAMN05444287_2877 [Octadecabacter temperatus]|uniref:Uncharacterized protein n=1 Tax=Octadecabacter temperatus TaxID=1458307 RepID=A0A0K0Y934_9RHOB|nr:hypothetical protein OSB_29550 [Octadecabacter temperatus]SIO42261.1 hypothetical protein SAMN05444287_2877 [Octadecabacter temperatus]